MKVKNVHERTVQTSAAQASELFESLGTRKDRLWPKDRWPAMRLDAPKEERGRGGHGPVRYQVLEHRPGERTTFVFENARLSRGIEGVHYFELEQKDASTFTARHVIDAELHWPAVLLWPLFIRPLHDALVEDALDNFERAATRDLRQPNKYDGYVRLLRRVLGLPQARTIASSQVP